MESNSQKKIVSNVIWALSGKVINMLSALFVGILVARYLGPEQYGIMNYIISYVTIFTVIASFGMDNIEIRELSRQNEKKETILGTCFALRIFFALVGYVIIVILMFAYRPEKFVAVMILAYALTLFSGTANILRNYFTSIVQNKYIVKSEILRTLVGAVIKIILLWIKAPLEYFIFAQIFDTVLVASGYYLSYKTAVGSVRKWVFDKSLIPFIVKESFPLVLSGAAVIIYQRIDQVMIGDMLNKTEVGYFATAGKFVDLILFLPTVLVQTVTPMLIRVKESTPEVYEDRKKTFVSVITWTSIIMAVLVSLLAYWLIMFTYGKEYALSIPVLQIMSFKAVGMALSSSGGQIIIMERMQKWAFIRNVLGCFLCIILNYLLIPTYGIIGSAVVTIVTVLFTGCISNILIRPYHSILKIQLYAIFYGWKELIHLKQIIKR